MAQAQSRLYADNLHEQLLLLSDPARACSAAPARLRGRDAAACAALSPLRSVEELHHLREDEAWSVALLKCTAASCPKRCAAECPERILGQIEIAKMRMSSPKTGTGTRAGKRMAQRAKLQNC